MSYSPKQAAVVALLIASSFTLVGCGSQSAQRIDPNGTQTITTVNALDIQDATDAAAELSQSLLESGVLGRSGQPSVIAIDRYVNNTSHHIDRDAVLKKIRVTLNKAGVAQTTTAINSAGGVGGESQIASGELGRGQDQARVDAFLSDDKNAQAPSAVEALGVEYALSFKILDNRVRAGRTRQTTYIFQMTLTDLRTKLAVWEDEKQITKQGTKSSVGW